MLGLGRVKLRLRGGHALLDSVDALLVDCRSFTGERACISLLPLPAGSKRLFTAYSPLLAKFRTGLILVAPLARVLAPYLETTVE